jgi:hypothetical protein
VRRKNHEERVVDIVRKKGRGQGGGRKGKEMEMEAIAMQDKGGIV